MQRGGADFTLWRIHNTQERAVIIRIGQHPQIGQQVFNFRTREERRSTGDFVGDPVLHEEFFEYSRLVVAAIQNGVIFVFRFIYKVMGDEFPGHPLGFVLLIIRTQNFEFRAISQLGKKPFFKDVRVIGNEDVRRLQDPPGGAVVLLQLDHL
ncbi:hypothetical protein SDC9_172998 [bioreactor metagenome]|uniref:Uncharacterized protein n=1 Tax=bioreactor metagenome TaxID=1076179 RepID=A0A645GHC7_9ZZZZ